MPKMREIGGFGVLKQHFRTFNKFSHYEIVHHCKHLKMRADSHFQLLQFCFLDFFVGKSDNFCLRKILFIAQNGEYGSFRDQKLTRFIFSLNLFM